MAKGWIRQTIYVDVETGVIMGKKQATGLYDQIRKTIKTKYNAKNKITITTIECKRGLRLFEV